MTLHTEVCRYKVQVLYVSGLALPASNVTTECSCNLLYKIVAHKFALCTVCSSKTSSKPTVCCHANKLFDLSVRPRPTPVTVICCCHSRLAAAGSCVCDSSCSCHAVHENCSELSKRGSSPGFYRFLLQNFVQSILKQL
jgi:hypothetical protein